jgi:hypothetical protein
VFATTPGANLTGQSLPVLLHLTGTGLAGVPLPTPPDQNFSANRLLVDDEAFLFVGQPGSATGVFRVRR